MNIQDRLNAAVPGDIVEVPGGIYFANLHFPKSGEPARPITLRGAPNEIVVINAGHRLETRLVPVPGLPEVFRGKAAGINKDTGIWEAASRLRLKQVGSQQECARRLGSWFFDAASGDIYLRSSGAQSADRLEFWLESDVPAIEIKESHIRVENLSVTLGGHGILVKPGTSDVRIENCRAYCNKRAGIHVSGEGHFISNNEVFANNQHGIQLREAVENTTVRGNHCYSNGPRNGDSTDIPEPVDLSLYSRAAYVLIQNNIAEGFTKNAYRNKYGVNATNLFRGNVVRGNLNPAHFAGYGNTFLAAGLGPRDGMYLQSRSGGGSWEKVDPSGLQRAGNLIYPADFSEDPRFADPAYSDYRLQADSPALGRGAYPGFAPIFYVDPARGAPHNDGLSQNRPLPTLADALSRAVAGSTIYLLPGTYEESVRLNIGGISGGEPLRIRAYGRSTDVRVTGTWIIAGAVGAKLELDEPPGAANVEVDGLHFQTDSFRIERAREVLVRHCVFETSSIEVKESENVRLDHNTFAGGSLKISGENKVFLTQSLLAGTALDAPTAGLVSQFNYIATNFSFGPRFSLPSGSPEGWAAPDFGPVGARGEDLAKRLESRNLRVAGLSPHGATLLWESPGQNTFTEITLRALPDGTLRTIVPAFQFEVMGEFYDKSFLQDAFFSVERHASLGELEPSRGYELTVTQLDFAGNRSECQKATFRTPPGYATPRKFYISPDGGDEADGRTRDTAWKTFHHALEQAGPGDEVIALPGVYREEVIPRISGTRDHPIRIVSESSGSAQLDAAGSEVSVLNVDNVRIEGFALNPHPYGSETNILVNNARNIGICGFETDYPPGGSFTKRNKLGVSGIEAVNAPGLLIEDNLFIGATVGIAVSASPDAIIRHNTLVLGGNYGVVIVPGNSEETYRVEGNLFDRVILDYKTNPAIWMFDPAAKLVSDYNLFNISKTDASGVGRLPAHEVVSRTLEEWKKASGLDGHSVEAEPLFVDPDKRNFHLMPASPGKAILPDSSDVGIRKPAGN